MIIAIEDASERANWIGVVCRTYRPIVGCSEGASGVDFLGGAYDIERDTSEARQVDVRHESEVLVPVAGIGADGVHLLSGVDQIRIVRIAGTAAIFRVGRDGGKAEHDEYKSRFQDTKASRCCHG